MDFFSILLLILPSLAAVLIIGRMDQKASGDPVVWSVGSKEDPSSLDDIQAPV